MDMEHEIPKKLGVPATHGDGEPPKILDAHYVKDIMYYFDNPEKTPFNYVMGDTLDQHEYFRDYPWHKKGNYYGIKFICCVGMLGNYAWDMIKLVALGWRLHTFPFHANSMIIKP